jgi:DNA repair protein RadD
MTWIPRDYQTYAVDRLYEYFRTHPVGHPVIAMPTGTGKAGCIAMFLKRAFMEYSHQKAIVATHVKELVHQNYLEFLGMWPQAPAGICSAGLSRKEFNNKITFAGIGSITRDIAKFGKIDLFIIDECHLLSDRDESSYMKVINFLLAINPLMKVIGLSATPWREGMGIITQGTIFTDIAFDCTDMKSFNWFIQEGYLAPLVSKRTGIIMDISGVHMQGGDFKEKELFAKVNNDDVTFAACQEAVADSEGRSHWLVFAAGIVETIKIEQMLNHLGVSARCVHSKMTDKERDTNIADWMNGEFVAMVNNGILTTGVNFKAIDYIVMLRPTASSKLWVQMLGRGTRPLYASGFDLTTQLGRLGAIASSEKQNCRVKDFAGNTRRLGPINDPVLPRKKGEAKGEIPIKECPNCNEFNHISARFCGGVWKDDPKFRISDGGCGEAFHFENKLNRKSCDDEVIKSDLPVVETFEVDSVTYSKHSKLGKPDSVKVSYYCTKNLRRFPEYVLFEHVGFGRRKAEDWWRMRTNLPCPATTEEALKILDTFEAPTHIKVWTNKPYPEIMKVCMMGEFAEVADGDVAPF